MIKTRSNEMKIEREKGYVWCLVGMSMRSTIWNQFWDRKWSQNGKIIPKFSKNVLKMLPKSFQNSPKWSPDRLWSPLGRRERFQDAFPQQNSGHLGPQIGPKIDPEAFKTRFGKRLRNKLAFETDLGPIFDRFSSRWKQIFDPNWKPLLAKWTWH